MERLMRAGLFGDGLLTVGTVELVRRYNECLEELGIAPTALMSFRIDGIGWSPEIAQERNDFAYLSAGIPNQLGIIVSPNQRNKPIYYPFHSYDRPLMQAYFARFKREIADITASRGIALDMDQELTSYRKPADLRLITEVVVRSITGKLGDVARRQKAAVEKLLSGEESWADPALREELVSLSTPYGDLRHRRIDIPDFRFGELQSFYTRAFGGVFVLTRIDGRKKLLVVEDRSHVEGARSSAGLLYLKDPATFELLVDENLLEINLQWYQSFPQVITYLKECLSAEILFIEDPTVRLAELNPVQRKKRLAALGDRVWDVYHELERFSKQLQTTVAPDVDRISTELRLLLARPNRDLPLSEQQVLRQFLHRLNPIDVVQMYSDEKNLFFEQYGTWPEAKKEWAVEKLTQDVPGGMT